jgi:pyrimidine operon attenuation protein / uracil phosphoribosyltransferase
MEKKCILTTTQANMKLRRMAFEIVERNHGQSSILLAGIKENGLLIANLLKELLDKISSIQTTVLGLEIDKMNPASFQLQEEWDCKDNLVILVDDVVNSGKTMVYAMVPFLYKSNRGLQTLTLVERSYKTYPLHVDYVGVSLATTLHDNISVEIADGRILEACLD